MNKIEKREAAFQRMTAEQRKVAEAKQKLRAEKKAAKEAEAAKKAASAQYEPDASQKLLAKKKFLRELALYFKAVQLNKAEYKPAILEGMKKELTVDDFQQLHDEYVDVNNCTTNTWMSSAPHSSFAHPSTRIPLRRKLQTSWTK